MEKFAGLGADKGFYRFRKMHNGVRVNYYLNTTDKEEAKKKAQTITSILKTYPFEKADTIISKLLDIEIKDPQKTVLQLFEEFIKSKRIEVKEKSILAYKTTKTNLIGFFESIGAKDMNLLEFEFSDANKFRNYLAEKPIRMKANSDNVQRYGMKSSTIKQEMKNCKAIFAFGIKMKWIKENPFQDITIKKKEKADLVYLKESEVEPFLESAKRFDKLCPQKRNFGLLIHDIFHTFIHTGLRDQELKNLRWSDIDLKNKTILVDSKEATTKGEDVWTPKATRGTVPISMKQLSVFERMHKEKTDDGFVFKDPVSGGQVKTNLNDYLRIVCKDAGIEKYMTVHKLRHTTGSLLRAKGVGIETIKEILRHSNIKETLIYAHLGKNEKQSAVDLI